VNIGFFWNLNEHLNQLKASKTPISLDMILEKSKSTNSLLCLLDPDTIGKPPAQDVSPWDVCRNWFPIKSTELPTLVSNDVEINWNDVWPEVAEINFTLGFPRTVKKGEEESHLELVEYSIEERTIRNFTNAVESLLSILPKLDKKDRNSLQHYINQLNIVK